MQILEYFKTISQIPHCSGSADGLKDFLVEFGQKRGYEVLLDSAKNILIKKGGAKLALQAHYDMVCVGDAPKIELFEEDGNLKAKNSSLGADNGIAIAMMMKLIDEGKNLEFLFTNDEEIGLIGANNLELNLEAKYMLNLDSEDVGEVYIGCAGGVDLKATKEYETKFIDGNFYEINIVGLSGGHSGVDIDKDIPNAIKVFGKFLKGKDVGIAYLKGGERINSIPVSLRAIVFSKEKLSSAKHVDVVRFDGRFDLIEDGRSVIDMINNFKNGVLSYNDELDIPQSSINLALINLDKNRLTIEASMRSMDNLSLKNIASDYNDFFKDREFDVKFFSKYPAWKPEINEFSKLVCSVYKEFGGRCQFKAIHAGLECGLISQKYPDIKIASIGPNIKYPHSKNESLKLDTVDIVYNVVKKLIDEVDNI